VANHRVSGQLVPDAVSGHVALELANTRAGWGGEAPREYLVSYDALAVWAADVGLLGVNETRRLRRLARSNPVAARDVVLSTVSFRESWYAVATSAWELRDPSRADLGVIASTVAAAMDVSCLVPDGEGRVRADGGGVAAGGLTLPLHRAALEAYDLLSSGGVAHVGRCSGHGCGWLFYDPSHRRHWCIMAICGNRAKARAFAERRRATLSAIP
jgi:predicted RNA-binding Zn ribbon-like protein